MLLDPKWVKIYAIVTSAALTKAVLIGLGYLVGSRIDAALGTSPLFLLLCVSAGLGLGLWWLIRMINRKNLL